jgi:hypothetical protein
MQDILAHHHLQVSIHQRIPVQTILDVRLPDRSICWVESSRKCRHAMFRRNEVPRLLDDAANTIHMLNIAQRML